MKKVCSGYTVADESGEAKVGEAVLCPPGTLLQREMLEKLDFHYIHFRLHARSSEGPVEFPYFGMNPSFYRSTHQV